MIESLVLQFIVVLDCVLPDFPIHAKFEQEMNASSCH